MCGTPCITHILRTNNYRPIITRGYSIVHHCFCGLLRLWFCKSNSQLKAFWSHLSPAKCRQTAAVRQFEGRVDVFVSWTGLFWTPAVQSLSLAVQKCRTGRSSSGLFDGRTEVPKWPKSSRVKATEVESTIFSFLNGWEASCEGCSTDGRKWNNVTCHVTSEHTDTTSFENKTLIIIIILIFFCPQVDRWSVNFVVIIVCP